MHAERFSGVVNWDFIGIGIPTKGPYAFAAGFFRLAVDGIPFTALRDPTRPIGATYIDEHGHTVLNDVYAHKMVNDTESALYFSFARESNETFAFGGSVKVIRKAVDTYGAWGIGFDFGLLFKPIRRLRLGIVLLDGTSTLIAWSGGNKELILPHLKMGGAYTFNWKQFRATPSLEFHFGFENRGSATQIALGPVDIECACGLEVDFKKIVALRLGSDRGYFTTGAGIHFSVFQVDYGFSHHMDLGQSHRVSLTLFWDKDRFPLF
jgi:hypothetical protein